MLFGEFKSKKSGKWLTVNASYTVIKNNDSMYTCVIVQRNITEKKIAEHLLKAFNKELNRQVLKKTTELKKLLERFNIQKATNDILGMLI